MDPYGEIKESSVVKSYTTNGSSQIVDYGTYNRITNMTDHAEPVTDSEGKLTFNPVSYTHLDVYKRQLLPGIPNDKGLLQNTSSGGESGSGLQVGDGMSRQRSMEKISSSEYVSIGCLLYTSRCV